MNHPEFPKLSSLAMEMSRRLGKEVPLEDSDGALELGRFLITRNALDIGAFRTPTLRNVELTAPYFHDGSAATLKDVLTFYSKGGIDNPGRDWELQSIELTEQELSDLIEFLKALTSDEFRRVRKERSQ
jgi:cytochrome c peroxidase